MQACGRPDSLSFKETAFKLYREEGGWFRFWKGAQAIVSGCLPADAAYFTVYEIMKRHFKYNNEGIDIAQTAAIGASATFAHDFFIAPSDSKQRLVD